MKYALLIHSNDERVGRSCPRTSSKAIYGEYFAVSETPGVFGGASCSRRRPRRPSACTTAETLTTDGPFAETKEALGGFYLFEADDLDDAIELAARIPAARHRRRGRGPADRGALAILEQAFRDEWGRVLASLIGFLGDFDLAEEAAQEAFAIAAERWPRDGDARRTRAPGCHDRRNRAIDRIRRERTLAAKTSCSSSPRPWRRTTWTRRRSRTSGSSSSSPAATRRSRWRRRSR